MGNVPESTFESDDLARQREFLRRLARGLLGDAELAEDVVQEAELRALERESGSGLRAWLVTVTRRLALNARRTRERRTLHEQAAACERPTHVHFEATAGLELQGAVLAAVRALDEPYRTVVWSATTKNARPRRSRRDSSCPWRPSRRV